MATVRGPRASWMRPPMNEPTKIMPKAVSNGTAASAWLQPKPSGLVIAFANVLQAYTPPSANWTSTPPARMTHRLPGGTATSGVTVAVAASCLLVTRPPLGAAPVDLLRCGAGRELAEAQQPSITLGQGFVWEA